MHRILKHKSIISIILIFAILMFSFTYGIYGTGGSEIFENCELIAGEKGNFLFITYNDKMFYTYRIDKNEDMAKISNENFSMKSCFFANGHCFLVGKHNKNLPLMKLSGGGASLDIGSISDFNLKDYCITAAKYDYIYAVDSKKSDTVYKYQINGTLYETYNLGKNIKSLFTDSNNIVFAVVDGGIFNVETGGFISCDVPSVPYTFSENYCCDSSGKIFEFRSTTGFKCVMQTDYGRLCVLNGNVYAAENNILYILDDSGKPKYKYELSSDIQNLCVSGNLVAIMYGNNVQILHKEYFDLIADESSNDLSEISKNIEPSEHSSNQNISSKPSTNSKPVTQNSALQSSSQTVQPSYDISSSKYNMNNGIITDIPQGTTIAQLKKNISYGSNTMTVTNHNNKIQTSGQVGTGWRIDFSGNGKTTSYYTVIVGDVTGEGNINSRDVSALADYILEKNDLLVYYLYAADLNSDGVCNSLDLLLLKKITE